MFHGSTTTLQRGLQPIQWASRHCAVWALLALGLVGIPGLYLAGMIDIETVNMLGRYLALAIVAVSLDLVWGYTGMLSLCQAFLFSLGGYAMGMYLAHHGGPEGIVDANGWKIPACLYVVYPYDVGQAPDEAILPWFWKPFYYFPATLVLGVLIPGLVAFVIGFFVFKSRVRGVFFAILTQAVTLAAWLVFCMNQVYLCGTNGLTRFDRILALPGLQPFGIEFEGFQLTDPRVELGLYVTTVVCLAGVYWLGRKVVDSRLGRVLIAIRDNETRLRFSGYKPHHFKVVVFALSGMMAGLGGMLYAPQMGIFTPSNLAVTESILVVVWVAVGGRGTLSGAVLGAVAVNLVYNWLTSRWPDLWPFVQGGLFIGVVLLFPSGLISLWHRWTQLDLTGSDDGTAPGEPGGGNGEGEEDRTAIEKRLQRLTALKRGTHSESLLDSPLLRVEEVTVVFDGFRALDIDHFSVPYYELQVVIGPNGAGKTTLCDVISGKTRPAEGRVLFAGCDVTRLPDVEIARMGVGRKFQTPTVFDSLTVYENMELALPDQQAVARSLGGASAEERDRIDAILRRGRLLDLAHSPVRYLSHGQRQWLEISMLVLAGPRLLLVDEPAAGLTDEETALTAELLLELQAEHSVIVIEHDMEFVRLLDSRVTVLNEGKIMAQGSLDEVQADPQVIEAYLGRGRRNQGSGIRDEETASRAQEAVGSQKQIYRSSG